jgi:hypothetical protein
MKQETVTVSFRAPKEISRNLKRAQKLTGLSRTALILSTLRFHLDSLASSVSCEKKTKN